MDRSESQSKAGDPNTVTVTITKDSSGYVSVDKDPVHVNKNNQTVEWSYGATDSKFTIVFPGECPFDKAVFRSQTQGQGESIGSGGVTSGLPTNIHKTYKYIVAFDSGEAIDPGVVLH